MKILYGVQGTGNGHISRARMLARHFGEHPSVQVDYLFSGRDKDGFFDMDIFGDFEHRRGLTFASANGKVSYPKTVVSNNVFRFLRDVWMLDLERYNLIITDFEPVSAWAGKLRGVPVIGMGHQYAFGHNIPRAGENLIARTVMKYFAPASIPLGLHWHHFGNAILPPIIDPQVQRSENVDAKKIVVYLPFENQRQVQQCLKPLTDYQFVIYSPELDNLEDGNLSLRKTSLLGFKRDLASAGGVICNSGFELISECLALGLPVLTKPQGSQMEQQSNAAALEALGYATTCGEVTTVAVENWLAVRASCEALNYPDVAKRIVEWIIDGQQECTRSLSDQLWSSVALPEFTQS